jgi:hypothetical protein
MKNGKREDKAWCSNHKWYSKHDNYELAGKCEYSTQIAAKNNAKVSPLIQAKKSTASNVSPTCCGWWEISRRILTITSLKLFLTV